MNIFKNYLKSLNTKENKELIKNDKYYFNDYGKILSKDKRDYDETGKIINGGKLFSEYKRREDVIDGIQKSLNTLKITDYENKPLKNDNVFGPKTQSAWDKFASEELKEEPNELKNIFSLQETRQLKSRLSPYFQLQAISTSKNNNNSTKVSLSENDKFNQTNSQSYSKMPSSNVSYNPKSSSKNINSDIFEEIKKHETFIDSYGFNENESKNIFEAYKLLNQQAIDKKYKRQKQTHHIFSNLAALCSNYSDDKNGLRWKIIAGVPTPTKAKENLINLGMDEHEVERLYKSINNQHNVGGGANKDFAHELIQYAIFSNDTMQHNALDGIIGNLDALGSYKGDVFSARMGIDDENSDLDATNIYNIIKNNDKDLFEIINEYNADVIQGKINRADEFLKYYGDGDAEKGLEFIKKDLANVDIGSHYIGGDYKGILGFAWENIQDALYSDAMIRNGVALGGEETFRNLLGKTNANQVWNESYNRTKNNPQRYPYTIEETKEKFIKYLKDNMSK